MRSKPLIKDLPEGQRKTMRAIIKAFVFKNGKDIPNNIGLEERIEAMESLIDKGYAQVTANEDMTKFNIKITELGRTAGGK